MKKLKAICLGGLVGLFVLNVCATGISDEKKKPTVTKLMHNELSEKLATDRDVIVNHVLMPPHTTVDWHRHPGEAFHYYLEGHITIEIEGKEPIHGTPGTVGHVPYRAKHRAITGEKGATVLVFRVHHQGEPIKYTDQDSTSHQ